ncbi:MAG TPA: hypothetical protein DCP90_03805 [Clostridiales bacterium]|nr:MAG: hypothetical protein A2Y22_05320 [Clostridiales bacterium GWD2_32_59]HAN09720.1 hypothetical protein [Clostridiales bacterium]
MPSLGELSTYVDGVLQHPGTSTDYQAAYTTPEARTQNTDVLGGPTNNTTLWYYWTRDARTDYSHWVRRIIPNGGVETDQAYYGAYGVRPALYLSTSGMAIDGATGATAETAYTIMGWN